MVWFAVANRQVTDVSLAPFPASLEIPVYLLVLAALALGVVVGGGSHWFAAGSQRRRARHDRRKLAAVERERDELKERRAKLSTSDAGAGTGL